MCEYNYLSIGGILRQQKGNSLLRIMVERSHWIVQHDSATSIIQRHFGQEIDEGNSTFLSVAEDFFNGKFLLESTRAKDNLANCLALLTASFNGQFQMAFEPLSSE